MSSPAAYLSEESASSNCPGTTEAILSRLQSMTSGVSLRLPQAASVRDGFPPSEPNRVSAIPASQIPRQLPGPKQHPGSTGCQDTGFLQTPSPTDRKFNAGSMPPEVPRQALVPSGSMRITVAGKGQSAM